MESPADLQQYVEKASSLLLCTYIEGLMFRQTTMKERSFNCYIMTCNCRIPVTLSCEINYLCSKGFYCIYCVLIESEINVDPW